ncbi:uncharacterized protein BT62DRAFT_1005351 [Guyanagaster necrorhizus]|uniref:Uncharacterized protein n=1 Tax=Guyanagaster necrorhizus TaxID=856835 RepID=A0A9P7VVJ6_9AGAR|nr:uncharacterized protein BT62DRAFT_1005351 [Guyanagaster necrorhizus MCA 3950]KAG7446954.1 hypothetical protein BT62DRAFT_1005351 [Guyanagaster necrorhizus MCA 3950]
MSSVSAAPSIFGSAPAPRSGSDDPAAGALTQPSLGRLGGKQREALKLRLDLNLEVEIAIKAKYRVPNYTFRE